MASGRAVVAVASGGPEEIIENGTTGVLVQHREASAIAREVNALVDHPDRRSALAQAAMASARAGYSETRMAREFGTLVRAVVLGHGRHGAETGPAKGL